MASSARVAGKSTSFGKGKTSALWFDRIQKLAITNVNANDAVWDYAISGTTMYVACDTGGAYVFNITDPANPVQGTTARFRDVAGDVTSMPVTDVIILGTDLYLCGRSVNFTLGNSPGLIAKYDISSTPLAPVWDSTYEFDDEQVSLSPNRYHNNWPQGMATDGTYIFLSCQTSGLEVIDPATMTLYSSFDVADLEAVYPNASTGVFWECSRIVYNAGWVYLANHGNGVIAIDVSTPLTPTTPQWYDAPIATGIDGAANVQLRVRNVVIDGSYLYACPNIANNVDRGERGLMVINISTPTAVDVDDWLLTYIGNEDNDTWVVSGDQPLMGLVVNGNYAYIANGQTGTAVFDITTPTEVGYLGLHGTDTEDETNSYMTFIFSSGGLTYAYYADAFEPTQKHNLYIDVVENA